MMPVLSSPRLFAKSVLLLFIFVLFIPLLPLTTLHAQTQPSVTSVSARRKAKARRAAHARRLARARAARRARLARARRRALGNTTASGIKPTPRTAPEQSASQTTSASAAEAGPTRRPDEEVMRKTASVTAVDSSTDSALKETPLPSIMPLAPSVDPFAAIESADSAGLTRDVSFTRTELVAKAKASAKVSLSGQTLLVRMSAKDIPVPTHFDVPRYALWVYVPNYQVKLYIGDLPITPTSRGRAKSSATGEKSSRPTLGNSESAYRYTALPPGAEFGGLMLTAEPVRYTPIVNEALRPVLVYLTPEVNPNLAVGAPAYYAGPLPESMLEKKPSEPIRP